MEGWRAQGAPIAERLRPGLAEEEMHELVAPLGLTLPTEARIWRGWHDGAAPDGDDYLPATIGPGGLSFVSLRKAIEDYQFERRLVDEVPEGAPLHPARPLPDRRGGELHHLRLLGP